MDALPPGHESAEGPVITGIGCPACHGVLNVECQGGRGAMAFTCRIGHTYATDELLFALEEQREARLWSSVTAFEELIAFLEELEQRAAPSTRQLLHERRMGARERVAALRRLIQADTPVELDADPGAPATAPPDRGADK